MEERGTLLGPLLLEEQLLDAEQLDRALRFAEDTGLPLDHIVVAEFAVPQLAISRLLARLERGEGSAETPGTDVGAPGTPPSPLLGARLRRPIGQIFVDLGYISAPDREAALDVQKQQGGLLGEILIEQGKLTRLELANALSEHWESSTGATGATASKRPSLTAAPRADEGSQRVEPSAIAELRQLLMDHESARMADLHAVEARMAAMDDALAALAERDNDEFLRATTERLEELTNTVESLADRSPDTADPGARLDALSVSSANTRDELEGLASRQAGADQGSRLAEIEQTLATLADTVDDRLDALAAQLRTETATHADSITTRMSAQTDELAASLHALGETVANSKAESRRRLDEHTSQSIGLATRLDDLSRELAADVDAVRNATDELRRRLDAATDLVTANLEKIRATQAEVAIRLAGLERPRVEPQADEIASLPSDHEPVAELPGDRRPDDAVKPAKGAKGKKKQKR